MTKIITLLTGNERKKRSFERAINGFPINVNIEKPWIPEIQATNNDEVVAYSARYGADLLHEPVVKMDSGFYIEALDGFPGPFVSYADDQIGADRFIKMLVGEKNRRARIQNSLAYCEPGQEPKIFRSGCAGLVVDRVAHKDGSFIDRLFIPDHKFNPEMLTMGDIRESNYELFLDIWGDAEIQFARWLTETRK